MKSRRNKCLWLASAIATLAIGCGEDPTAGNCPSGQIKNASGQCVTVGMPTTCPEGQVYNPISDTCDPSGTMGDMGMTAQCPAGQVFDSVTMMCQPGGTSECPAGSTRNPATGRCESNNPDGNDDGDLHLNGFDNCPQAPNDDQADGDGDGVGDACDNCLAASNSDQLDTNDDGIGDACDVGMLYDPKRDSDNDGVADIDDTCPGISNPSQLDSDGDGLGDECDNCPNVANYDQADSDGDSKGDACSPVPVGMICANKEAMFQRINPNLFIVLDRSGSMCGRPDGSGGSSCGTNYAADSKWANATRALDSIANELSAEINFGLSYYSGNPANGQAGCNSTRSLNMGQHPAATIKSSYSALSPNGGTPTATALKDLRNGNWVSLAGDPMENLRPKAVVLITDGITTEECDGGHGGAVSQVTQLAGQGIRTYAIGFGAGASPAQLNELARAGMTNSFLSAEDTTTLVGALRRIANEVITCSYALDAAPPDPNKIWVTISTGGAPESVPREGSNGFSFDAGRNVVTINGSACAKLRAGNPDTTTVKIEAGCSTACMPEGPEVCDYRDNDCDGEIDEGCEACVPEICDGMDNDCDGQVDEGCLMCTLDGKSCTDASECCNGSCEDGLCGPPCRREGLECTSNDDCCGNSCAIAAGETKGICADG